MSFLKSVFSKVKTGLSRTRETFTASLRSLLIGRKLDEALIDEIEVALLQADVGVKATGELIETIRADYKSGKLETGEDVMEHLKAHLKQMWPPQDRSLNMADEGTTVILVTGINGAGKTTSIAKLCKQLRDDGKSVMLAAADTFRAGAVRQLEIWAERLGVELIKGQQGGDPAAVVFDACVAAKSRGVDVLIVDTAGRLHTQNPLMRQLGKIRSVIEKQLPGAPHETLLVLDATTGQNAIEQGKHFTEAVDVTGIFLAKLDGTAKGGIVVAIRATTNIPVKFVGVGETPDDVEPFDPETFVEALFAI